MHIKFRRSHFSCFWLLSFGFQVSKSAEGRECILKTFYVPNYHIDQWLLVFSTREISWWTKEKCWPKPINRNGVCQLSSPGNKFAEMQTFCFPWELTFPVTNSNPKSLCQFTGILLFKFGQSHCVVFACASGDGCPYGWDKRRPVDWRRIQHDSIQVHLGLWVFSFWLTLLERVFKNKTLSLFSKYLVAHRVSLFWPNVVYTKLAVFLLNKLKFQFGGAALFLLAVHCW